MCWQVRQKGGIARTPAKSRARKISIHLHIDFQSVGSSTKGGRTTKAPTKANLVLQKSMKFRMSIYRFACVAPTQVNMLSRNLALQNINKLHIDFESAASLTKAA